MLGRVHRLQFERYVASVLLKRVERGQHETAPRRVLDEAHTQTSLFARCNAMREPIRGIDMGEDRACFGEIGNAGSGQLQAARRAFEKRRADGLFEILNLPGNGGLRDMQMLGRGAHAAQFGNGNEVTKMAQFHVLVWRETAM